MCRDLNSILTVRVTGPDLIATRTGEVKRNPLAVGAQAKSVRQALAALGELAGIGAVQIHIEDLAHPVFDHLDEYPLVIDQQSGCVKDRDALALHDFME